MSVRLAELRTKAAATAGKIGKFRDDFNKRKSDQKKGAELWSETHETEWRALNAEYDAVKAELEEAQREADIEARATASAEWLQRSTRDGRQKPGLDDTTPDGDGTLGDLGLRDRDEAQVWRRNQVDRRMAFQAWASHGCQAAELTDEHRNACQRLKFNPAVGEVRGNLLDTESVRTVQRRLRATHPDLRERLRQELLETRALSALSGGAGAYLTVPSSTVRTLEMAMVEYGAILQACETMTTETGEEMGWPVMDDTGNEGEYVDENNDATANGEPNPSLESVVWRAYDLSSKLVRIPNAAVRDSFMNLDTVVGLALGERLGRKLSRECTNGVSRIRGIVPRSAAGKTAAGATAITWADTTGLEHSVDPAYRNGAGYMFHDLILEKLRLIVDSQNRPLWISNIREGVPDTFNGRPYFVNQMMDSTVASGKKTMLFGQLSAYKLRRVGTSLRLKRLVERFAERDQIGFIAYLSADGNLLRAKAAASCPTKYLIQP